MSVKAYLASDAAAVSLGADRLALRLQQLADEHGLKLDLRRTGSRGMIWLEPLLEIEIGAGRLGFGPLAEADLPGLIASRFETSHARCVGLIDELDWMKRQQRVTFVRCGIIEPTDFAQYRAARGLIGLQQALAMKATEIVTLITESGLRGRGGAAFPTGRKWETVLAQDTTEKFIACNADEGDSGTFADRMMIEGDPFALIEGMVIAGLATGAQRGYIYLRAEYPRAARVMQRALLEARRNQLIGGNILGSRHAFDIELRVGAGAYICGEETSMLESLEGRRGEVRVRPPMPAVRGLHGQPTVVNNVLTLATVPAILADGAASYRGLGRGESRGTLALQLGGNVARGGLLELPFGLTLEDALFSLGGGSATGRPLRAAQVGGPLGAYLGREEFDVTLDYESLAARGAMLGHGGVVAFDDRANLGLMARHAMQFCADESCGKCTPCRVGSTRAVALLDALRAGTAGPDGLAELEELCQIMLQGSLCGLGGMAPIPVQSIIKRFPAALGPNQTEGH
ncbi:MAG: NADH-ubiquinone oxidoreductase-F iron-sulfur binding region domain-containing protein [Steroidobacteraceae bacterium]